MRLVPKILVHDNGDIVVKWSKSLRSYQLVLSDDSTPPRVPGKRWIPVKVYTTSKKRLVGPFDLDTGESLP